MNLLALFTSVLLYLIEYSHACLMTLNVVELVYSPHATLAVLRLQSSSLSFCATVHISFVVLDFR